MGCVVSLFPVAIFKVKQQPQLYRMYAFHRQLFNHDHVNSFISKKKKARRKKDNKKASSNILVQTSIIVL